MNYNYYGHVNTGFKATKREILFSIIILFLMIGIGFFISNKISNYVAEKNEVYYQSTKIDNNSDEFKYAIKTNLGNCLAYGEFSAVEDVSISELNDKYFAIEKETERYTMHTRVVYHRSGKTTYTTTENYYTWDNENTEYKTTDTFEFLGLKFPTTKLNLGNYQVLDLNKKTVSSKYQSWISGGYLYNNGDKWASVGDLRFEYSIVPTKFKGSILAKLKDSSVFNVDKVDKQINIENYTIHKLIQHKQDTEDTPVIIFWIVWSVLIIGAIVGFYYIDNKWLEDNK